MENLLHLVLAASGVVIAIALLVALAQLSAIRKSLQALVAQSRVPLQPAQFGVASGHILPLEEAPTPTPPLSRPVIASAPPPAPVEPLRFEEVPEPVFAESSPEVASPPAPPAPTPRFEEASQRVLPIEEAPRQVAVAQQAPAPTAPAYPPTTIPTAPPPPAEPGKSRMPTIIGIVVLVLAIAFLVFVVLFTK